MSSDKCSGCSNKDKCSLDDFFEALSNPEAVLKPGEKVSMYTAKMVEKGGLRALFNPGVSYQDAMEGRIVKSLLIVEDDSDLRKDLINLFRPTVFEIYAAANFEDAIKVIEKRETLRYALIDDLIPEARGAELGNFADKLYDKINEKFPEARVFAYAENVSELKKPYLGLIDKNRNSIDEVYKMLISDSENTNFCVGGIQ
jgi:CheY-like chemotaxis protein